MRHQENVAKQPKPPQTGWFTFTGYRKTTPAALKNARGHPL
jgi:hypothetical protein